MESNDRLEETLDHFWKKGQTFLYNLLVVSADFGNVPVKLLNTPSFNQALRSFQNACPSNLAPVDNTGFGQIFALEARDMFSNIKTLMTNPENLEKLWTETFPDTPLPIHSHPMIYSYMINSRLPASTQVRLIPHSSNIPSFIHLTPVALFPALPREIRSHIRSRIPTMTSGKVAEARDIEFLDLVIMDLHQPRYYHILRRIQNGRYHRQPGFMSDGVTVNLLVWDTQAPPAKTKGQRLRERWTTLGIKEVHRYHAWSEAEDGPLEVGWKFPGINLSADGVSYLGIDDGEKFKIGACAVWADKSVHQLAVKNSTLSSSSVKFTSFLNTIKSEAVSGAEKTLRSPVDHTLAALIDSLVLWDPVGGMLRDFYFQRRIRRALWEMKKSQTILWDRAVTSLLGCAGFRPDEKVGIEKTLVVGFGTSSFSVGKTGPLFNSSFWEYFIMKVGILSFFFLMLIFNFFFSFFLLFFFFF